MARWLSFFAEYNFEVMYNPGKQNELADRLSRRPYYELVHVTTLSSSVTDLIRTAYAENKHYVDLLPFIKRKEFKDSDIYLPPRLRARLRRYSIDQGLLCYRTDVEDTPGIVVLHDKELKYRILYETYDSAVSDHLGRETTNGM